MSDQRISYNILLRLHERVNEAIEHSIDSTEKQQGNSEDLKKKSVLPSAGDFRHSVSYQSLLDSNGYHPQTEDKEEEEDDPGSPVEKNTSKKRADLKKKPSVSPAVVQEIKASLFDNVAQGQEKDVPISEIKKMRTTEMLKPLSERPEKKNSNISDNKNPVQSFPIASETREKRLAEHSKKRQRELSPQHGGQQLRASIPPIYDPSQDNHEFGINNLLGYFEQKFSDPHISIDQGYERKTALYGIFESAVVEALVSTKRSGVYEDLGDLVVINFIVEADRQQFNVDEIEELIQEIS